MPERRVAIAIASRSGMNDTGLRTGLSERAAAGHQSPRFSER
jgi:hypothetical protein